MRWLPTRRPSLMESAKTGLSEARSWFGGEGKAGERIPVAMPWLGERELERVIDCVRSGWISSLGQYITEFEAEFSEFCGARFGIATTNGTTALHLALVALGIGPGD